MRDLIYRMIYWVAEVHQKILSINDNGGYYFTDKQLHFLVIGALGLAMIFVVYPIFKLLANSGHTMVIAWLYVFTLILVICFAIEIGQWYSGTGRPEAADITYGIMGFLFMFAGFAIVRGIFHAIVKLIRGDKNKGGRSGRSGGTGYDDDYYYRH
ncbi:MAG: hypothetical protein IJH95_03465 [Mogibacterium sp.]|nr:hypothetical protein [Mogibacterium sp.]